MKRANQVLEFLEEKNKKYCDDCLSLLLKIEPRQQVNQISRKLLMEKKISRNKDVCAWCSKIKLINYVTIK
jgi:hypothetical protein